MLWIHHGTNTVFKVFNDLDWTSSRIHTMTVSDKCLTDKLLLGTSAYTSLAEFSIYISSKLEVPWCLDCQSNEFKNKNKLAGCACILQCEIPSVHQCIPFECRTPGGVPEAWTHMCTSSNRLPPTQPVLKLKLSEGERGSELHLSSISLDLSYAKRRWMWRDLLCYSCRLHKNGNVYQYMCSGHCYQSSF